MKILLIILRLIFWPIKFFIDLLYGPPTSNLVGYAWYERNQYQKLIDSSQDNIAELVPTFDTWRNRADENIKDMEAKGWIVFKVKVDVAALNKWLKDNGLENVVENRERYVNHRMKEFLSKSIV